MSSYKKSIWWAILLVLPAMMACAQESPKENIVLGEWATSVAECKRPELKFADTQLDISVDADGVPTSFKYSNIRYVVDSQDLLVQLNERHPYSKTSDKEALRFKIVSHDTILLELLKNKTTQFGRCARQNGKK